MVIDAGTYDGGYLRAANGPNGRADILVDGAGSTLTLNGGYAMIELGGNDGHGSLTVSNNAVVSISGNEAVLDVGIGNDAGPTITESQVYVLSGGKVNVSSQGVQYAASVALGENSDGNGYMRISGAGSQVNISSVNSGYADEAAFIGVGEYGEGTLLIAGGGRLLVTANVNDEFPGIGVGTSNGGYGRMTVTGGGSLARVNGNSVSTFGASGYVLVGGYNGGDGGLTITNGGRVLNDPVNSISAVGWKTGSMGYVTVDGNGNANTLFDGGEVLAVGADHDLSGNTIGAVGFNAGGNGTVTVLDSATVRADDIFVGSNGRLEGNATFDGDVTVRGNGGGTIAPGASPGTLSITGDLSLGNGTMEMEINGTTSGSHDLIDVAGNAAINNGDIKIIIGGGFVPTAGDSVTLVQAADLSFKAENFDLSSMGIGAGFAFRITDVGNELRFVALNNGSGDAAINFGAASTNAASATIAGVEGYASGGNLGDTAFINVNQLRGTSVADTFIASGATADLLLQGNGGDDLLEGGLGADAFNGGGGTDTVSHAGATARVTADLVNPGINKGSATGDTYLGIENLEGSDFNDSLRGNSAQNQISGGADDDALFGRGSADVLVGGEGGDVLNGGGSRDTASYADAAGGVTVDLNNTGVNTGEAAGDSYVNIEIIEGSGLADTLRGDAGDNELRGGQASDSLFGRGDNDKLIGDGGADTLNGGNGDDNLQGGGGADTLVGLAGVDLLTGDAGNDRFDFNNVSDSGVGGGARDRITDFEQGKDLIDLAGIDAITGGGDDAFTLIAGNFTGVAGELRTVTQAAQTRILGDVNGDAVADFEVLLTTSLTLNGTDFIL